MTTGPDRQFLISWPLIKNGIQLKKTTNFPFKMVEDISVTIVRCMVCIVLHRVQMMQAGVKRRVKKRQKDGKTEKELGIERLRE